MLFYFDGHVLDPERRQLRRGVVPVALEPQVFDLLLYLLRNRERVVSKDELIETVWGGRIVSDATIDSRVKAARQVVGDSGARQLVIRTLPRKGVRLIAEVREEEKATPEQVPAANIAAENRAFPVRLHWLRELGLEQYAASFIANEIDEAALPSLTAQDLKDLGITSIGHRRRLLDAIAALRSALPQFDGAGPRTNDPSKQLTADPPRLSVVVLPFANTGGNHEEEYFADGVVEDITTALSRTGWLFVIARNSAFTYKGRAVDVRQIGRDLGVRYVVEGSVRRAGEQMRITSQLIEAASGRHIWADRFDGNLSDVFALQDSITESIVSATEPSLQHAEALRASSKPTESLDAYDCYLRALLHFHVKTKTSLDTAVDYLRRALVFDGKYALAKGFLAYLFVVRNAFGWGTPGEYDSAVELACEALAEAQDDPLIARWVAHPLLFFAREYDRMQIVIRRAILQCPYSAQLLRAAGLVHTICGPPDEAIGYFERAIRLSPLDLEMPIIQMEFGMALVVAGRNDEGLRALMMAVADMPALSPAYRFMIIVYRRLGRMDDVRHTATRLLDADPGYRISTHTRPFRDRAFLHGYESALRAAGLPE